MAPVSSISIYHIALSLARPQIQIPFPTTNFHPSIPNSTIVMSSNDTWQCGDCNAVLQASRTATRHWRDKQAGGQGHQGTPNIIHHPAGPLLATQSLLSAPVVVPSAPVVVPSAPPAPVQLPPSILDQLLHSWGNHTDGPLQLRSSRSTRNQDHQAASRNRPGVVDLDPTEGLPVQKWAQVPVRVNQDPSVDPASVPNQPSGITATSSAEWAAQFNTPQFPWPEKELPSFFSQLTPHNQEMIRRARAGNTNPKLSTWNSKTNSWNSGAEAEMRQNAIKSGHFTDQDLNVGANRNTAPESPAHEDDDDHEEKSDNDSDGEHADDGVGSKENGVKRRKKYIPEERTFEAKRWMQVPSAVADRTEERKFLADRRPGMPSLYGGAYQNQVFGSMGLNTNGYGFSAANAGYDLGEGGGLANAGSLAPSNEGAATPVRRNMPPKRKKKKGGPGRKKANPNPDPQNEANNGTGPSAEGQTLDGSADGKPVEDTTMGEGDNDGSDSGSEAEGSEEGEIDEGGHDHEKEDDAVAHQVKMQEEPNLKTEISAVEEQIDGTTQTSDTGLEADKDPAMIAEDLNNAQPEHHTTIDLPPADVIMEDAQTEETPIQALAEAETIPSITQPLVSEQLSDIQPLKADPAPVQEIAPESPPNLPTLTEQGVGLVQSEAQVMPSTSAVDIASLDTLPTQPTTQLSPVATVTAEVADQATFPAPNADPAVIATPTVPSHGPEPISTSITDSPPALASAQATSPAPESAPAPAPAPAPITTAVDQALFKPTDQQPTSPDLLGGLEDELNKNMGEQANE